jgi:hypothetical protein
VRFATWDGIDRCGQRLADEVRAVAAAPENASLTRISFIGHSMGGGRGAAWPLKGTGDRGLGLLPYRLDGLV